MPESQTEVVLTRRLFVLEQLYCLLKVECFSELQFRRHVLTRIENDGHP